ncbi:ABC transporter family protein [Tritrichomonas foetus]|uniref:ABC transporter family protein n=1 Tax=Tritrichomonas foetus TaxID=1144522 RepID=A0A1J4JRJ8_9EUKA|nr:ABC transporter family protein [Tritrichomonas foetus]|eukprot:OHT01370.1 ABC transporter family protein [Tritrichomonas foetus]
MPDLLIPLTSGTQLSPQVYRSPVMFSSLFKKYFHTHMLLRKRTKNYYANYIIGIIFPLLYLMLSNLPKMNNDDDPDPYRYHYPNELSYTQNLFSQNNSHLFISPSNELTENIAKNLFTSSNYKLLSNVNDVASELNKLNDSSETLFGLHFDSNSSFTAIGTTVSYMYSSFTFSNAFLEFILKPFNATLSFSSQSYARPPSAAVISSASIGAIYFLISKTLISLASTLLYYSLNSTKVIFLLEINGITNKVRVLTNIVVMILEQLPCDILIMVMFCFVGSPSSGTNALLFLISDFLLNISFFSIQIFFQPLLHSKGSSSGYGVGLILFVVVFEYFIIFQSYIPTSVYRLIMFLCPPASFISMCDLMIRCKEASGPMGFGDLGFVFNHNSAYLILMSQLFGAVFYAFLGLLGSLCNPNCYGRQVIGWKNIFKPGIWKKAFSKSKFMKVMKDGLLNSQEFDDSNAAIEFYELLKVYKGKVETKALDNVTLKVAPGEVIVAIGPNGSGKSTLVSSIIGAIDVDSGSIKFYGEELLNNFDTTLYPTLGVTFQDNVLIEKLTTREHFRLFCALNGLSNAQIDSETDYFANLLQLTEYLDSYSENLSGGNKRKLCIALSLLRRPAMIILDEPTAGVDAQSRQLIWKALNELAGATVFITTHSIEESESISSRLLVMSQGQIAFCGTAADLREQYNCCYFVSIINQNVEMEKVLQCAHEVCPSAKIHPEHPNILMIPNNLHFPDVLDHIDSHKSELGIENYTVHVENLEETMRKIIEDEEALIKN